jgi:hypothetical protein
MSRDRELIEAKSSDKRADITASRNNKVILSREDYRRKKQNMKATGDLEIDMSKKPHDFEYRWITVSIFNEPNFSRERYMGEYGWTPVPAHRHPETSTIDYMGRKTSQPDYIIRRGLLLCERPTIYVQEDEDELNEQTRRITEELPAVNNPMNDQSMVLDRRRTQHEVTRTYTVKNETPKNDFQRSDFGQ